MNDPQINHAGMTQKPSGEWVKNRIADEFVGYCFALLWLLTVSAIIAVPVFFLVNLIK